MSGSHVSEALESVAALPERGRDAVIRKLINRTKKVGRRRGVPIHAYVGPNGSGKSLAMVRDTIPSLDAGRRVLSTVRLVDEHGADHPMYEKFVDWRQLLTAEHCDVLMDEVTGIASSRESQGLPWEVANVLVQLRRRDIQLRWTAPAWARSDKIIREVTQAVTECRGYMSDRRPLRDSGRRMNVGLWLPKRMFTFKTYDTNEFEEWTAGKRDTVKPICFELFYSPGDRALTTYNTWDAVSIVGEQVVGGGICLDCGLPRRRQYCTGHDH